MKRKIFLRCIIVVFLVGVLAVGVSEYMQRDISSGIVRLHIIANSDSSTDQKVKLAVRDEVIEAQSELFPDGVKRRLTNKEKQNITSVALDVLEDYGVGYGARVETGKFYFPTKEYENITLPAGEYDAVRVILGEGRGKNWWCVMYPPLCFTDSAVGKADKKSESIFRESMGEFQYDIISKESIKTVPAFKLVEIWSAIKEKIK